jgi:hypothetical protein
VKEISDSEEIDHFALTRTVASSVGLQEGKSHISLISAEQGKEEIEDEMIASRSCAGGSDFGFPQGRCSATRQDIRSRFEHGIAVAAFGPHDLGAAGGPPPSVPSISGELLPLSTPKTLMVPSL